MNEHATPGLQQKPIFKVAFCNMMYYFKLSEMLLLTSSTFSSNFGFVLKAFALKFAEAVT